MFQRPHHLLARFARVTKVIFFEEPAYADVHEASLHLEEVEPGLTVAVPRIPAGLELRAADECQRQLLDGLLADRGVDSPMLWYYTPKSLAFSDHLNGSVIAYDCVDEQTGALDAPADLVIRERQLFSRANVVFTADDKVYEAKRVHHRNVHLFPSIHDEDLPDRSDDTILKAVDHTVAPMSWDETWAQMKTLLDAALHSRTAPVMPPAPPVRNAGRELIRTRGGFDYLIVGAGFAGSVLAERLASQAGKRVMLIDRRSHVGGNAYDCYNDSGILVHPYGPHIFHTNSRQVFDYLSQFTAWRPYEHRVLASVDSQLVPIPINLTTINRLYGLSLTPEDMEVFLAERAEEIETVRTSEDVVVGTVGRELYEKFFRGYTRKQWGVDPSQLDKSVTARIPTRTNTDDRYFGDQFQVMPLHGYSKMFERMLDHPNIKVLLNADFREIQGDVAYDDLIYTGPIDEYFGFRFGELPYRSLRFQHVTLGVERFQPVAVVNYPMQNVPYTRITEYKHLTGQAHALTSISYEYPCSGGDPYYPVPRAENAALYKRYQALAEEDGNVTFVGRLATYRYYNMDQVIAQALTTFDKLTGAKFAQRHPPFVLGQAGSHAAG